MRPASCSCRFVKDARKLCEGVDATYNASSAFADALGEAGQCGPCGATEVQQGRDGS